MAIRDPERYFDRRTLKRHLKRGNVTEADHRHYLTTLPDLAESVKPPTEGGDDDGFEARAQAKARRASGELGHGPITAIFPILKRAPILDTDDDDDDDDFDDEDDEDDDDAEDDAAG